MPGPVVFGALIDSSCAVWDTSCASGARGACAFYNNAHFRWRLHGGVAVLKMAALLFYLATYVILRRRRRHYEDEIVVFDATERQHVTIYDVDKL